MNYRTISKVYPFCETSLRNVVAHGATLSLLGLIQCQLYRYFIKMSTQPLPDPHENLVVVEDRCFEKGTNTRYIKGNFLGKGGFARCYELICEGTTDIYAVKIIQKSALTKQRSKLKLVSEIKIHQSLSHRSIVKFRHNFQDNQNVYILLELCTNKTLNDLIKRKRKLSQSEVKFYMLQVLDGLEYLQEQKIIHRDLKLGNLFLADNMQIKIGDFGLATKVEFTGEHKKTICGTPNYIAPEILESKGHSYEVDIWSFGVIAYTLIYGRPPFESKDVKETYKKIKACSYTFPDTLTISPSLKNLISSCLQREPHRRPAVKELKVFDFFRETPLTRQPSVSFRNHSSSVTKEEKELSDNGKLYTNNDLVSKCQLEITSKDTTRQKSQDKFLATERTNSLNPKSQDDLKRVKSHRVLKDLSENYSNHKQRQVLQSQRSAIKEKEPVESECVSVKKWIDYSSKYGIGYALNNGAFGVYFNDSTKMLAFNDEQFYYIQKLEKEDVNRHYHFRDHPYELKKKVSLFNHFKSYLQPQSQNRGVTEKGDCKRLVYVRRWFRSKHAVIFRLSNKSVQVIFIDQSQLLINSLSKQATYVNKHKEKWEYSLADIMQSANKELIKRFEYTKEVLNEMASNHEKRA